MKLVTRYLAGAAADVRNFVLRRDRDLPPVRYQRVGAGDFREMGRWLAAFLVERGLRPDDRVLDIGCGIGRVALALAPLLSTDARYAGFDADRRAIRWCTAHITARYPNFRFDHADVASYHHPHGIPAVQYRFPHEDGAFDFAYALSLFTHLEFEAAKHYFAEAHRVLRGGGVLVATAFLFDGAAKLEFPIDRGDDLLRGGGRSAAFRADRLPILLPHEMWSEVRVERGSWRESGSFSVKGQDVITARKRP